VADANQATGQDVKEKAAQELMSGNSHDLLLAAMGVISPTEGDAVVFKSHDPVVGDGDAVGVAGQAVEHMFGSAEGRLGVNDPVRLEKLLEETGETAGSGQMLL
jgi:hypothetical protein